MPLTVVAANQAKPKEKPYKLFDGGGLFLLVSPSGSKAWKLAYRFQGVQKKPSMIAPAKALEGLDDLGLDTETRNLFLGGNAERIFKV